MRPAFPLLSIFAVVVLCACNPKSVTDGSDGIDGEAALPPPPEICVARVTAPSPLPRVRPEHETLDYWLGRVGEVADLDEVLLDPAGARALDASYSHPEGPPIARVDLRTAPSTDDVRAEVAERLAWLAERFADGRYLAVDGSRVPDELISRTVSGEPFELRPSLRVALADIPVRCAPWSGSFYTASLDLRFDRNNCSTVRAQEPVQVLASAPGDMVLVRAGYTTGWIAADAPLSPPVPDALAVVIVGGPRIELRDAFPVAGIELAAGISVAAVDGDPSRAIVAHAAGFAESVVVPSAIGEPTVRNLTRRALLEEAFAYLGTPYGWGGQSSGRDCSRFLMDVFESFGIRLPRFSAWQARAGSFSIDVSGAPSEHERMLLIDAAAERGAVLLHFPGHIMLYLGRNDEGVPMAIHAFAEYVTPCDETDTAVDPDVETLSEVDRITVSDLEIGRGSSRGAFVERLTRVTVIGGTPGVALDGVAERRRPAPTTAAGETCVETDDAFVVVAPRRPNERQPLRVLATRTTDPGSVEIAFVDPDGVRHVPEVRRFGGPPYSVVAEIPAPTRGTWSIVVGDGDRILGCERAVVSARPPAAVPGPGPVWEVRNQWSEDYENLYALWVESLFSYPADEDLTWTSMHELTRDPVRNLLYDYYGQDEDSRLELQPDCADLPYMLRAYFAWKAGLPYGFRRCNRGRAGSPPRCQDLSTNLMERADVDDVDAFQHFARRSVRSGVHSASGRTHPMDDDTDFYPVPLRRDTLRPGTLYADPYGHLLVIAGWLPQATDRYGVLIGADAQPDGTVGRRRFWRGSFLFSPDTEDVGAGFKAYRPLRYDARAGTAVSLANGEITERSGFAPFSLEQYEGTIDDFYGRMEAIINPRPLDPRAMLVSLVDALDESVSRRLTSVDNGEAYMAAHRYSTVEMPTGYAIFETSGPWEDFSTPSRDMRLLISVDTVYQFPERVRRAPERYGFPTSGEALGAAIGELEALLDTELAAREFAYTRSDGSRWSLTLADVVARRTLFEMAYNPNDCVEIRWSADPGSEEYAPCDRHAPSAQRDRMTSYRSWFADRQRPPR